MPEGAPQGTDLFEIIHTTRAMRRLKPDPVPDDLIRQILLAGQAAASGGNTQRWRFLVLRDPAMGIPPGFRSDAVRPSGYPMGRVGPVGRVPLSDVVYLDGWGKPYPGI